MRKHILNTGVIHSHIANAFQQMEKDNEAANAERRRKYMLMGDAREFANDPSPYDDIYLLIFLIVGGLFFGFLLGAANYYRNFKMQYARKTNNSNQRIFNRHLRQHQELENEQELSMTEVQTVV